MKIIRIVVILLLLPAALYASDFSLVANIHNELKSHQDEPAYGLNVDLWPRLFMMIGDDADLVVSAGLSLRYEDKFHFIPELLQTNFTYRFGVSGIRVGRMSYADPLSYAAEGLFDGLQFFYSGNAGRFNVGAWYTGFLYKKNANITMTKKEMLIFDEPVNYEDFSNTYFAPARMIGAIGWEHPSLGEVVHLSAAALGQFDLTDEDTKYNSQYLMIKAAIPKGEFLFEVGGSVSVSQTIDEIKNETGVSFAGEAGFYWLPPLGVTNRISVTGKYASGKKEDSYDAFNPITTRYVGNLSEYRFSALSVLSVNYSARFAKSFGAALTASYFIRNDLGTITSYPVTPNSDGYFLGPEAYLRMLWSPMSDIQFNFGGGAFFPSLGDAGSDEPLRWRADLKVIIAIL